MAKQLNVDMRFTADSSQAQANLQALNTTLNQIASINTKGLNFDSPIRQAVEAAKELKVHLTNAFDVKTGNLNLNALQTSLKTTGTSLSELSSKLLNAGMAGEQSFLQLAKAISTSNIQIKKSTGLLAEFSTTLKNTARWQLSSTMLHGFMGAVQSAYGYAQRLNESLNNIRIVTGHNTDYMAGFAEQANKAAKALSSTTLDYTNASLIYYQQGLSDEEVKARTDVTIKLANVTRDSAETVSSQMTAIWNNFDDGTKSLEYYADAITALGASTASSSAEIAQGLQKFASVADTVGLSYEYATASLATVVAETRQSADTVGTAFKTLFSRMQGLKLGETLDDGTDLTKYSAALATVGVNIKQANGDLKDMDDILDEVGLAWQGLATDQQVALAQTVAGVRQYNQFISLMDNWAKVKNNIDIAANSEGTLQKQSEIYASGWEAAQKRVKASLQELYHTLIDEDFFIGITNGADKVVESITTIIKSMGGVKTILGVVATILLNTYATSIGKMLDTGISKISNIKIQLSGLAESFKNAGLMMSAISKGDTAKMGQASKGFQEQKINGTDSFSKEYMSTLNALGGRSDVTAGFKDQVNSLKSIATLQNTINLNAKNLTAAEQERLSIEMQQLQTLSQQKAEAQDQLEVLHMQAAAAQDRAVDEMYADSNFTVNGQSGLLEFTTAIENNQQAMSQAEALVQNIADLLNTGITDPLQRISPTISEINNQATLTVASEDQLTALIAQSVAQLQSVSSVSVQINSVLNDQNLTTEARVALIKEIVSTAQQEGNISKQILDTILNTAEGMQKGNKSAQDMRNTLRQVQGQATQTASALNVSKDAIRDAAAQGQSLGEGIVRAQQAANNFNTQLASITTSLSNMTAKALSFGKSMSTLIGTVSSVSMSIVSIQNAINQIKDPNVSWPQKLMTGAFAAAQTINTLNTITGHLNNTLNALNTTNATNVALNQANAVSMNNMSIQTAKAEVMKAAYAAAASASAGASAEEAIATEAATLAKKLGMSEEKAALMIKAAFGTATAATVAPITTEGLAIEYDTAVKSADTEVTTALMLANAGLMPYLAAIAAILAVVAGVFIVHNARQKAAAEQAAEQAKQAREAADAEAEKAKAMDETSVAYENAKVAYERTKKAYDEGSASAEELREAQDALANAADTVATSMDLQGSAIARLSGHYEDLTEAAIEAQKAQIESAKSAEEAAAQAARIQLGTALNKGTWGKSYQRNFFDLGQNDGFGGYTSVGAIDDYVNEYLAQSQAKFLSRGMTNPDSQTGGSTDTLMLNVADKSNYKNMIAAYEEVLGLYDYLQSQIDTGKLSDAAVQSIQAYQAQLQKYLEVGQEAYAAYTAAQEAIDQYEFDLKALENRAEEESIGSVEEYRSYRDQLIQDMMEARGIMEDDAAGIQAVTAAVDQYLAKRGFLSEFALVNQAFDEVAEKAGMTRDEVQSLFETLSKEIPGLTEEVFLQLRFSKGFTIEDYKNQIQALQAQLDQATAQANLEAAESAITSLTSTSSKVEDINANSLDWGGDFAKTLGLPEGYTFQDFMALTTDEQLNLLTQYRDAQQQMLDMTNETNLAVVQAARERLEQEKAIHQEEAEDAARVNDLINELLQMISEADDERDAEAQAAFEERWNNLIAEIQGTDIDLSSIIPNIEESPYEYDAEAVQAILDANQQIIDDQEERIRLTEDLTQQEEELTEAIKAANEADAWRASLMSEADRWDIDYEDVKTYAKYLRTLNDELAEDIEASERMALANKKLDKGVKDLVDNYDDYIDTLKTAQKGSADWADAINSIREDMELILDIDLSYLSDEFLESADAADLLKRIAEGDLVAIDELRLAAAQDIVQKIAVEIDTEEFNAKAAELNALIAGLDLQDIEIGTSLDTGPLYEALQAMLDTLDMSAEEACQILQSIGYDPEVEFEPVALSQSTDEQGNAHYTYTDPLGNVHEVDATDVVHIGDQSYIMIPKINAKNTRYRGSATKTVSPSSSGSGKKSGGGGGGGGSKEIKHAEGKKDSEKERYHTLLNQLEDLSAAYDRVSTAADRAFGKDKLKLIDGEIDATQDLIDKQKEYLQAIQKNLPTDKAIMEAYVQKMLGMGVQYDESGNIANFDAIQDAMWAVYNAKADALDSSSTEWQVFEDEFEELQHWIEQYEETYDLLRDEEDKLQEYVDQQADLQLKKIQYAIELKLNVADDSLAVLNYQLDRLEDKAFSAAEAIALMGSKVDLLYDKVAADREGLEKVLGQQLSSAEIQRIYAGDMSVLQDKHFTDDQIQAIKDYRDDLLDLNKELLEVRESVQEKIMDTFDEFNEKLEDQIDLFDHYNKILENYKNIIDIVGKSYLKVDKELLKTLNQATINNAINKVKGTKDAYDALVVSQAEAEKALQEAIARGNEIDIAAWEEDLEEIQKKVNDAQENMMQAWEDALQSCAEMFELAVEDAIDNFNKAMLPFGSLEEFQDAYDKQKEVAEQYLDDYDKIYELSKLARNVNNSINDAPNIAGKQKLAKLLEKINKYQEDGVKMSEYELEYLQKEYDLRLAEIAMEEALNAKSVVRLTRDNEGNYSYSYTADSNAVDDAAQKYEDALHAMQELSSNYIDEMSDQLIDATEQMEEELAAVRVQDYASIEDYYKKIDEIQQYWLERMGYMQGEFQKALDNNKALYDEDWKRYADATGYKISADEDFAKSYQDTVLGKLFDSEDDIIDFQQRVNDALGDSDKGLIGELLAAYIQWQENTEHAMEAAGTSSEGFAEHMEEAVSGPGGIVDQSEAATESVENMATQMIAGFTSVVGAVDQWQSHYSDTMDAIIAKNMDVIEAHNLLVKALSTGDSTTSTSGSQSTTSSGGSSSGSSSSGSSGSTSPGSGGSGGVSGGSGSGSGSDLSVGSYVDVKSGTKWYADSYGGAPWGWARSGTIQYTAEGNPLAYNIEGLGWIRKGDIVGYGTGGYTGEWGPAGRLAMLHEKEVVLNAEDSANFLSAIEMVRDLSRYIDLQAQWQSTGLGALVASAIKETDNVLQQQVSISADFPNVSDRNEIEAAFNSLVNTAAQYANRKNPLSGIV